MAFHLKRLTSDSGCCTRWLSGDCSYAFVASFSNIATPVQAVFIVVFYRLPTSTLLPRFCRVQKYRNLTDTFIRVVLSNLTTIRPPAQPLDYRNPSSLFSLAAHWPTSLSSYVRGGYWSASPVTLLPVALTPLRGTSSFERRTFNPGTTFGEWSGIRPHW